MEKINLQNDLKVFGVQVKDFPEGTGEEFDTLAQIPGGLNRSFYGISKFYNGIMLYYATAEETYPGEAEKIQLSDLHHRTGRIHGLNNR